MKLDELPWVRKGEHWEYAKLASGGELARSLRPDATINTPSEVAPVGTLAYCPADGADFLRIDKLTAECLAHEHFKQIGDSRVTQEVTMK